MFVLRYGPLFLLLSERKKASEDQVVSTCIKLSVSQKFQVHKKVGVVRTGYWCLKEWAKPLYSKLYETGMLILILIGPLTIMTFAYSSIGRELWVVSAQRATMRGDAHG